MKYVIIVNPHAGNRKGLETAKDAASVLASHGIETELLVSDRPGRSLELASRLDVSGTDGVIAVGGDGTLYEVINGLLAHSNEISVPLGLIPVGTGNSFIRDTGIGTAAGALDAIVSGRTRRIDLARYSQNNTVLYFVNLLGTGFVSNVACRAARFKRLGPLSYIVGVFQELAVMKPDIITLTIDGRRTERNALFVEICNSRYTGGKMMMSPDSEIDDGLLDVVVLNSISRRKFIGLFPSIFSGTHVNDPAVEVISGREIMLESSRPLALTPDGEISGSTPVRIEVLPRKMEIFA